MDRAGNICGIEMEHTVITVAKYCRRMLFCTPHMLSRQDVLTLLHCPFFTIGLQISHDFHRDIAQFLLCRGLTHHILNLTIVSSRGKVEQY